MLWPIAIYCMLPAHAHYLGHGCVHCCSPRISRRTSHQSLTHSTPRTAYRHPHRAPLVPQASRLCTRPYISRGTRGVHSWTLLACRARPYESLSFLELHGSICVLGFPVTAEACHNRKQCRCSLDDALLRLSLENTVSRKHCETTPVSYTHLTLPTKA